MHWPAVIELAVCTASILLMPIFHGIFLGMSAVT